MKNTKRSTIKKISASTALVSAISLAPNRWIKPIVTTVIIPAHAQTSICENNDIAGEWEFIIDGDIFITVTLTANGKGAGGANALAEWKLDGLNIEIFLLFPNKSSGGFFIQATVTTPCTTMEGGNSIINPGQPISPVIPNTFIATKKN